MGGLEALVGLNAPAQHAALLLIHLGSGALLFGLASKRLGPALAAGAAAMFLTAPAVFDSVHWLSGIGDLLACTLLLAALGWMLAGDSRQAGWRGWAACLAFALALSAKEIAVGALPLLILLEARRARQGGGPASWARAALLLLLGGVFAFRGLFTWSTGAGESYAMGAGAWLHNLPAYVTAGALGGLAARQPSDIYFAGFGWVSAVGWTLLAVWVTALAWTRSREAWFGFAWFVCLAGPVLLLEHQFYFYYLTCALPGLAFSLACLLNAGLGDARRAAAALACLAALQGMAVEVRARARLPLAPLPTDFVLRRAAIARNSIRDLGASPSAPAGTVIVLGQQPVAHSQGGRTTGAPPDYTPDPFWDQNVRAALADGDAIRLYFPAVDSVVFRTRLRREDSTAVVAACAVDGHIRLSSYRDYLGIGAEAGPGTLAEHFARASALIGRRAFEGAVAELRAARGLAPENADILVNLGSALIQVGDTAAAREAFADLLRISPADPEGLFNLGLLEWREGHHGAATALWDRLRQVAPGSDLARMSENLRNSQNSRTTSK